MANDTDNGDDGILNKAWDWLSSEKGAEAAAGVIGGGLATFFGSDRPDPTGYQGKIPNYTYNRQPLPQTQDPNRRPGGMGRRYFSDGTYSGGGGEGAGGMPSPAINQPAGGIATVPATQPEDEANKQQFAQGGIASLKKGEYLRGKSDGMADEVDATIDSTEPAALSHGEFVIPADVVSHLGNGNSEAGANVLKQMMERVRRERTGNKSQGKEIDPNQHTPA